MQQAVLNNYRLEQGLALRKAETVSRDKTQLELLRRHLRQAGRAPFYKEYFAQIDFSPADLSSITDLKTLPLTARGDLERTPAAFFPAGHSAHADIALTSGTTGNSIIIPYTTADLERLAFNEMMAFYGIGLRPGDRVLLCVTLDRCFIAGLAYYSGLVRLGAAAIRSGPGQPARQWQLIEMLKPKAVVGVPSFLLQLARWGEQNGISPRNSSITSLITIGEPIRQADLSLTPLGKMLQEAWGARVFSSYGATEMETAFCECAASCGGHVHPELMIVEIVDEAGNNLPAGAAGEVVVTPLGVEGLPLVRFRTGDISRLHVSPCACGWRAPRLGPVEGRLAQRLKVKGTTLYPEMIFQVLEEITAVQAYYVEARSTYELSDEIRVIIGGDNDIDVEEIQDLLQARLRVRPQVIVRSKGEVLAVTERAGGRKQQKFFDYKEVNLK